MIDKKTIENFSGTHRITDYMDAKKLLLDLYHFLKSDKKKYSYLQLSVDLGLSKTNIAYLLAHGSRKITVKNAKKIAEHLALNNREHDYWLALVAYQNSKDKSEQDRAFQKLLQLKTKSLKTADGKVQLSFFSEWYHITIYEMIRLKSFPVDPEQLAAALNPRIRPEQARKSLELLDSLGLISFDQDRGRWLQTQEQISTGDEIASMAITSYHKTMMGQAQMSLTECEPALRDISAVSIAVPLTLVPKLKAEISQFRKQVLAMAAAASRADAVYQLNIQLFPSTQLTTKEEDAS